MTMQIAKKTAPSRKRNNKGFSLIELIIVITIMAILTALLAPQLLRYVEQSRVAKDAVSLDEVYRAVQLAYTTEAVSTATTATTTVTYGTGTPGALTVSPANTTLEGELARTLGPIAALPALVSGRYTAAAASANRIITITVATGGGVTAITYTHPSP